MGAVYTDQDVVVDGDLVTGAQRRALPPLRPHDHRPARRAGRPARRRRRRQRRRPDCCGARRDRDPRLPTSASPTWWPATSPATTPSAGWSTCAPAAATAVRVRLTGVTVGRVPAQPRRAVRRRVRAPRRPAHPGHPAVRVRRDLPGDRPRPAGRHAAGAARPPRRRLQLRGPGLVGPPARRARPVLPAGPVRRRARSTTATTARCCGSAATRPTSTSRRPTRSPGWSTAWPPPTCSPATTTSWTWPSGAPSTCATTCASSTADEDVVYWYHGIDVDGDTRAQAVHLRVRRRLRRHPDVRADLRARRPDPDLPGHRRPAHRSRHRRHAATVRPVLPGPRPAAATSRTSTRSCSARTTSRSARTGPARTGTPSATTPRRTCSTCGWRPASSGTRTCWPRPST